MAKKLTEITQNSIDQIMGSVGYIFPRTEKELDNFNNLYSDTVFDLDDYILNPDKIINNSKQDIRTPSTKFKFESNRNSYFKRAVLAAEIASQLYNEPTFGQVKFQKLMFLCENIDGMNISYEYSKQAAGPYDNKLMHSIGNEFEKQRWFKIVKENSGKYSRNVFVPMENFGNHKQYFNRYFIQVSEKIQWLIDTLRKEKTDWVELIATLYACWMELELNKKIVSENTLLPLLYSWSKEKQKYSQSSALSAIQWMKENNVIPR